MAGIEIRRFEQADESRTFEHGSLEVVTLGGVTIGPASYEPGWAWSTHVGKPAGQELCQVEQLTRPARHAARAPCAPWPGETPRPATNCCYGSFCESR